MEMDDPKDKKVSVTKLKAVSAPGDTIKTPRGNIVTKQMWQKAAQNGLPFSTHQGYADWIDTWAHPSDKPDDTPNKTAPVQLSDKAKGTDNTFNPARGQNSQSVATIKSNRY